MRPQNVKLAGVVVVGLVVVAAMVGAGAFLKMADAGSIAGVQWNEIGPAPVSIDENDCCQGNGPDSGQVVDVAIDPRGSSDQIIFIATQDGGIWRSTDGGNTWGTTTDFLSSLSMGAVALDPGNPSIVYAGTGSPANTGFFKFVGVYQSTDDGGTWTLTPGMNSFFGVAIRRIVMPATNQLLIATDLGLVRSTDGMTSVTQPLINGANGTIDDLHLDTATATTVLAAVDSVGIFRSTDSGATWGTNLWKANNGSPLSVTNFTPGFISFSQSTQPDNKTIYASVQNTNAAAPAPKWGLFVSTDSGGTWAQASAGGNPSNNCGQCGYNQTIGVDPLSASTVYLGFVNIWKSTDSGGSFTQMPGKVHNDHHALIFSPHVPGSPPTPFYVGTDGGVARSTDGSNFTDINGPNPGPGQAIASNLVRDMDIGRGSSSNNGYSYGGMQDTGTAEFAPGDLPTTWHLKLGGDGAGVAVDPYNPAHAIAMADACLNVTTNGGGGWSGATVPNYVGGLGFNFGNTLAFDQVNSSGTDNTVYASVEVANSPPVASCFGICFGFGSNGACTGPELFRSTDGGSSYAQFASPKNYLATINAIATVKIDPNTIWLGLNDGTLQVSTNATSGSPSFAAPASQPAALPGQGVQAVAIDPTNTNTVVAVYGGFCGGACNNNANQHVFMTTDGGTTWADISGTPGGGTNNLPDLPVHSVVIDPNTSPHTIIVANDAGVLQTADNGQTWQVLGIGMPTVDVVSLALDSSVTPELLRAGTFGRSVFELGAAQGPLLSVNSTFNFGTLCPGQTPTELLQLFNLGSSNLTISDITLVSGSSDFALSGPSFPVTILPGEEVDYTVSFAPKSANEGTTETATFQVDSNAVVNPNQQITYTATVGQPIASTTIASAGNFGNVCVGSSADLNLTIANSGTCNLTVTGITSGDPTDFIPPTTLTYPVSDQTGNSLAAPLEFAPKSFGLKSMIVTVDSSDNPGGNLSVSVSGNAPPPAIAVSGNGSFGNVCAGSNAEQNITIANTGPCDLDVTSVTIDNGSGGACPDFTIVNNPFPNVLSADSSLPVTIAFTPTSGGPKSCRLVITSNDPNHATVTVALSATTPAVSIDVPLDQNFPATVIQSVGACSSQNPFPVSNNGSCPVNIDNVVIGGTNGADYSTAGLPSLPTPMAAGSVLGAGDLDTVFKPTFITRDETGTVSVTYETDPITHATTTVTRNLCGEGTSRGARVLVTVGGTPVATVDKIHLSRLNSNRKAISIDNVNNAPLETVTQGAPCASFEFQREWGGLSNPIQLTAGDYQLTVTVTVNGKKESKTVSFTLGTCSFDQNIVVGF